MDNNIDDQKKKVLLNKSNKIKILIVSMILFATSIVGITYAYFAMDVIGNETASSARLKTASRMLQYNDVQIMSGPNALPGWSTTKTLTVTNLASTAGYYNIIWREITNTVERNEMVISATCTSNISGRTCPGIPETPIVYAEEEYLNQLIDWSIEIAGNETHTYQVTVTFKNMGVNQDYNQFKNINGTINVSDWVWTDESCFTTSGSQITDYTCDYPDIVIPNKINGVSITSIANNAFKEKSLTSVVIPRGVTSIGQTAFYTNSLVSAYIPYGVTSIGNYAFRANKLASLVMPDSVTSIGYYAFENNELTSLEISEGLTTISQYAFRTGHLTWVVIPSSVTLIRDHAFYQQDISSLLLPEGLVTIENDAFHDNELTDVIIPSTVTTISNAAFRLNHFAHVTIPSGVTTLGNYAFGNGNVVESVIMEGKSSTADFTTYGTNPFNWASDVTCVTNNTSNVTNGCITWMGN